MQKSLSFKKFAGILLLLSLSLLFLSGCGIIGEKNASMSVIYATVSLFSLVLLVGYCLLVYKKELWFVFLFLSVFVVNTGYYLLSVSKTLDGALFANRLSYLGSVFLPMIMLTIIMKECKINFGKWFTRMLLVISILVFLLAASPGYLDIYYKSVSLANVNGVSVLEKVYGPLHSVYLFYLLFYFGSMVSVIIYAKTQRLIEKSTHAAILTGSVFVNICVWLFEQLVKIDFELLSVSYIISEVFLLGIHLLLQEKEEEKAIMQSVFINSFAKTSEAESGVPFSEPSASEKEFSEDFEHSFSSLTPTERKIFELHLSGKKTKEIMEELCITENTIKFHNKNIYHKFGVTSKKQLLELSKKYLQ